MKNYLCKIVCFLFLLSGFFFLFSCSKADKTVVVKPSKLIEKPKLTKILFDVYVVESVIYFKGQKGIDVGLYTTTYYRNLFAKHGVTRKQFYESLSYYLETDDNASKMFLDVINELMSLQKTTVAGLGNQQITPPQDTLSSQMEKEDTTIVDPIFRRRKNN